MTILFPALCVAFTAFCVWLGVRIVNRRERWAKWTLAMVIGVPVLYVASFGPACWILSWTNLRIDGEESFYAPMIRLWNVGPSRKSEVLHWYACLGAAEGWRWMSSPRAGSFENNPDVIWLWTDNMP
jgi:hypothetical protein